VLQLGWDTEAEARRWHAALEAAVEALSATLRDCGEEYFGEDPLLLATPSVRRTATADARDLAEVPGVGDALLDGGAEGADDRWGHARHVNGVRVLVDTGGFRGSGPEAYMMSCVVRDEPSEVFDALFDEDVPPVGLQRVDVLDARGDGSRVVRCVLSPPHPGTHPLWSAARWVRPRGIVQDVTWREDEDGTYVVLAAPEEGGKRSWGLPAGCLPMELHAAVTIAPLRPEYRAGGATASRESLLTLVLRVPTGGRRSWSESAGRMFFGGSPVADAIVEQAVDWVVAVRDAVDQQRFMVEPVQMPHSGPRWHDTYEHPSQIPPLPSGGPQLPSTVRQVALDTIQSVRAALLASRESPLPGGAGSFRQRPTSPAGAGGGGGGAGGGRGEDAPSGARGGSTAAAAAAAAPASGRVSGRGTPSYPQRFWSCPGDAGFRLRGANYLKDRVKAPAAAPEFELCAVELFESGSPDDKENVAARLPAVVEDPDHFFYVANLLLPGPPHLCLAVVFRSPEGYDPRRSQRPFDVSLDKYANGSESDRNDTFKLIPRVVEGSWIVQKAVGSQPCLLGRKLRQAYYRGDNYIETDIDIASSSVAAAVVRLVAAATKTVVVDLAFMCEGQTAATLPEALIGTVRLNRIDLGVTQPLPEVVARPPGQGGA